MPTTIDAGSDGYDDTALRGAIVVTAVVGVGDGGEVRAAFSGFDAAGVVENDQTQGYMMQLIADLISG